tara:strand:- start:81 stop:455 length:375 start_codon:yes stop_codon:yes gene_type:complete
MEKGEGAMSWEKILKISTKDAIADAGRHMHEEDKNPSPVLDSTYSRRQNPNISYSMEISNLMEVKAQMKELRRGYEIMKKSHSLLSTSLFHGYDDEYDIAYHLENLEEPISNLENSMKQVGKLQ